MFHTATSKRKTLSLEDRLKISEGSKTSSIPIAAKKYKMDPSMIWEMKNLSSVKVSGESANEDSAIKFCNNFTKLLQEDDSMNIDNIYNMEDIWLLWKTLRSKTSTRRKERVIKNCVLE